MVRERYKRCFVKTGFLKQTVVWSNFIVTRRKLLPFHFSTFPSPSLKISLCPPREKWGKEFMNFVGLIPGNPSNLGTKLVFRQKFCCIFSKTLFVNKDLEVFPNGFSEQNPKCYITQQCNSFQGKTLQNVLSSDIFWRGIFIPFYVQRKQFYCQELEKP